MTGGEAVKLAKIETMLEGHIKQTERDRAERMEVAKAAAESHADRDADFEARLRTLEAFNQRVLGVLALFGVFAGAAGAAVTKAVAAIL